ncbi:MAG: MBL fold metallo-hydrolase [Christensenellales bacterium]|jgi:7,8-dihydropterin-6-yl-methyl-4-(beta-D-ribofuranosyl)aminobenzene 5'-phosphate synthase
MDNSCREGLLHEHGLALYIEYQDKRILFDTGASKALLYNAQKMGIDLRKVDYCVISHAHYDHAGGLAAFLALNHKAQVYMKHEAKKRYYHGLRSIGVPRKVFKRYEHRITYFRKIVQLFPGCTLLPDITLHEPIGAWNRRFWTGKIWRRKPDRFFHEMMMALAVQESGFALFTGCSHSGVYNMLRSAKDTLNGSIRYLIGGFHLSNAKEALVQSIAKQIQPFELEGIFTCHCTGDAACGILRRKLPGVQRIMAGDVITLDEV